MSKLILTVLIVLLAVHSLALVGFLGYGAATGRFDQQKRNQYLATWRGEILEPPTIEEIDQTEQEAPQQASARIKADQRDREILSREMQLHDQHLRDKQVTIDAAQSKLEKDIEKLRIQEDEFAARIAEHNEKAQNEDFKKALKIISQMKSKYVKDDFMKMDDSDVIRYLAAMKADTATNILNQFKTPDEKVKRIRLIKMLEQYGVIESKENKNQKPSSG